MRLDTFLRSVGEGMARVMRDQGVGDLQVDSWQSAWALTVAKCDEPVDDPRGLVAEVFEHLTLSRELVRIYGRY